MRRTAGFSLIEVLMAILIAGIVAAIAVPVFTGQRDRAKDHKAQAELEQALRQARSVRTSTETYPTDVAAKMAAGDSALNVTAGSGFSQGQVQVERRNGDVLIMRTLSRSGRPVVLADMPSDTGQSVTYHPGSYVSEVLADDPVGYWRMGESAGAAADLGAGNNPGIRTGAVTRVAGAIAGDPDGAASVSTTAGYTVPDAPSLRLTGPLSVEVWVKYPSAPWTYTYFLHKGAITSGYFLRMDAPAEGTDFAFFYHDGANPYRVDSGQVAAAGQWYHLVATYDLSMMRLYINGQLAGTRARTGAVSTSAADLRLGLAVGAEGQPTTIDEAAVYDHVLSADRVAAHYKAGLGS